MGGLSTEVENDTKNIVLEAAYFDPLSIRKTSTKIGLKSESSTRFERKIDYDRVERALDYACQLMVELAGATVYDGVAREVKVTLEPKYVTITTEKINRVLGTELTDEFVLDIFDRLAYEYTKNGLEYTIKLPSRRMDLEPSVQDIIEDVARMYGYDNIPTTIAATRDKGYLTYSQKRTRLIRQILANLGLNEAVSYSLISEDDLGYYVEEVEEPIKVLMPLTEERAYMRESVLNGLVDAIQYNKARKNENLAFFEISNVHTKDREDLHLGIVLNGLFESHLWKGVKQVSEFYLLKAIVDDLFNKLNFKVTYQAYNKISSFHPGRCAAIMHNGKQIGVLGELHPKFAKAHDVLGTVAFEMDLQDIINEDNGLKYHPINKFPSITRDLAIVVKREVSAEEIVTLVKQTARKYLTKIDIFDVYTGENVLNDEKSIAFSMTFEDPTKTLEAQEVDKVIHQVLNRLEREIGAKLR